MIFLAGDIGGTHARLLLGRRRNGGWETLARDIVPSARHANLDAILARFLENRNARPEVMVLALAGPVTGRRAAITNLPWTVDADALASRFGARVELLNDFAAQGHGLGALSPDDLVTLQAGEPVADGVRALLGAGTGLGMAQVVPCAGGPVVVPGEGGHMDFAPTDAAEIALWEAVRDEAGRASIEHLLSGPGIERIYRILCRRAGIGPAFSAAADISRQALADPSGIERQALAVFVRIYGAVAGNLALLCLPRGGLYVAGGIAPKILPLLEVEGFMARFCDKPPMGSLLQTIPVHVVCNESLGLLGAAEVACRLGG